MRRAAVVLLLALIPAAGSAPTAGGGSGKPRARALGIRFDGTPGSGFLEGPIAITNTHSVGVVRDAIIAWQVERNAAFQPWSLPVVAETYDGYLPHDRLVEIMRRYGR